MNFERIIEKNKNEIIKVSVDNYKDQKLVNIRVFVRNTQGELIPTKKGIAIRIDLFQEFKKILDELEYEFKKKPG